MPTTQILTRTVQRENLWGIHQVLSHYTLTYRKYLHERGGGERKDSHRKPNRELRYNTDTYKNSPEGKSVGNSSGVESLYSDILLSLKIKIHKCLLFGIINTIFALVLW